MVEKDFFATDFEDWPAAAGAPAREKPAKSSGRARSLPCQENDSFFPALAQFLLSQFFTGTVCGRKKKKNNTVRYAMQNP